MAAHFALIMNANYRLVAQRPRRTAISGCPRVASYDVLGEQLHNSNSAKREYVTCLPPKDRDILFTIYSLLSAKQRSC